MIHSLDTLHAQSRKPEPGEHNGRLVRFRVSLGKEIGSSAIYANAEDSKRGEQSSFCR